MKLKRLAQIYLFFVLLIAVAGCGGGGSSGGGGNVTGTLTVAIPTITSSSTFSQVSFTVTYTNPFASNVGGVPVDITTSGSGGASHTVITLNNNGSNSASVVLGFIVPRDAANDQVFSLTATTGDLVSTNSAIIPHQAVPGPAALSLLPTSITFTATAAVGDTQTVTISGGTGNYSVFNVNPSPNANIGATINGSILTIKKLSLASGGSATILVGDNASPPSSATLTVNY